MTKRPKETELYPRLASWLKRSYGCFATAVNIGPRYSRVDVVGIRDVGGELSGEVETIAIEVKNGSQPFATTTGQARGYSVYANRVYLAEWRSGGFTRDEIDIASHLGVGLIDVRSRAINECLSSPYHNPVPRLQLSVFERMGYGPCCVCGCVVQVGSGEHRYSFTKMSRASISKAAKTDRGLVFWNHEVGQRKRVEDKRRKTTRERRFLCADCVANLFPVDDDEE